MRKSVSVVRRMGSGRVSVMRTRQAPARLIGTSAYLRIRARTSSDISARWKAAMTARRRSKGCQWVNPPRAQDVEGFRQRRLARPPRRREAARLRGGPGVIGVAAAEERDQEAGV